MATLLACLRAAAPLGAALGAALSLGVLLRRIHLFAASDGETAAKFVTWITLPSLILQSFNGVTLADIQLPVLVGALLSTALSGALSWLLLRTRHPKERGLLAGAAAGGGALALAAVPLAGALFGPAGTRVALLCGLANSLAVWVASYLLFSTAGAAFLERYEHADGGTYRGEWLGMLKQGYGVYAYPSGARYEGEWRNNAKEGRGVYHFPKGGVYEGEWRGGRMEGVGVRTFASGKVQAGVWREGRLEVEWDEWQCALAVEGASEAAAAARRVQVGGGTPSDALRQLLADPPTWAYAVAAALALTGRGLTPTLDLLTGQLALAHGPLALATLGLTLELGAPPARQAGDVGAALALRLLPPLLLAAAACAAALRLGWPAASTLGMLGPFLVCAAAPAAPQVLEYAHRFRLNESLAAAIARSSTAAGLVLMPLLAAAAVVSATAGSVLPFLVAVCGAATGVAALAVVGQLETLQPGVHLQSKVRMRYAPAAASPAAPTVGRSAAPQAAGGNSGSSGSRSSASAAAPPAEQQAAAAPPSQPEQPQQQRRPSAFTDVGPDQQQQPPTQPQALPSRRRGSAGLRLTQPHRPLQRRPGAALQRSTPCARPLTLSLF
ncbi:hypothetical protein ABPG75_005146 [Micractinium tetrahymenae]